MPVFLKDLEQIRAVEWGKRYLWDIKFEDPDIVAPFDSWFPAQDVEQQLANITTFQFDGFLSTYQIPQKNQAREIRLTFIDDAAFTLESFFEVWIRETIFNLENHVATLSECVKLVSIVKTNSAKEAVKTTSYWVFPSGPLIYTGASSADNVIYSMPCIIAGVV